MKQDRILGIIPARGGSKGLPHKNIRLLSGKPLIAHTIKAALATKRLEKVVVSTDDPKIARIARQFGAEVPFLRARNLAKDDTPMIDVVKDCVNFLEKKQGFRPAVIVLLQPTSPFREFRHIDSAIKLLLDSRADSVVSLCECRAGEHPYWMKRIEKNKVTPFMNVEKEFTRRQDLPKAYRLNGAIYVTRYEVLMLQNKVLGEDTRPYIMDARDSIDIDNLFDLEIADCLMSKKIKRSKK